MSISASYKVHEQHFINFYHAKLIFIPEIPQYIEAISHFETILDDVKMEMQGSSPVVERLPLHRQFANFEAWFFNAFPGKISPRVWQPSYNLPALLKNLWVAQDTGDREMFRQMQKEIFTIWKEVGARIEKGYLDARDAENAW